MSPGKAVEIVVTILSPTLIIGAALQLPRCIRYAKRLFAEGDLRPDHAPIEALAAQLRRLLLQHEAVRQTTDAAMRTHVLALEGAITDCATDAAAALGIAVPRRPRHEGLPPHELSRLLRDLAHAGLVLPSSVDLLSDKGPR